MHRNRLQRTLRRRIPPNCILMGEAIARVADALRRVNWEKDDSGLAKYLPFRVLKAQDEDPKLYWYSAKSRKLKINTRKISIDDQKIAVLLRQECNEIALDIINALHKKELIYDIRFSNGLTKPIPDKYAGIWHARANFLIETGYVDCRWKGERGLLIINETSFGYWLNKHRLRTDADLKQGNRVSSNEFHELNAFCAYVSDLINKKDSRFTNSQWESLIDDLLKQRGLRAIPKDKTGNGIVKRCILLHDIHVNTSEGERNRGSQGEDHKISSQGIIDKVCKNIKTAVSFEKSEWLPFKNAPPRNNINFKEPSDDNDS